MKTNTKLKKAIQKKFLILENIHRQKAMKIFIREEIKKKTLCKN